MAKQVNPQNSKGEFESNADQDPKDDELELKVVPEKSRTSGAKFSFDYLKFTHTVVGSALMEEADRLFERITSELGNNPLMPHVAGVENLFNEAMQERPARNYIPIIEKIDHHVPGSLDDLLKCKFDYEVSCHKSESNFSLNSIKNGAAYATAKVNWDLAIKVYKENRENAEDAFKEAIYAAHSDASLSTQKVYSNLSNEIADHANYYSLSGKVAAATNQYCKNIAAATTALSTAYGVFVSGLTQTWIQAIQVEATLIVARQTDSTTLWNAIKTAYNKRASNVRTN